MTQADGKFYDVCLSFAAEQRAYVEEVAMLLTRSGLEPFYDIHETVDLWGRDLAVHLDEIYGTRSGRCILFASADYARKVWTNQERAAAQAHAARGFGEYILPVRFDDTKIPGLPDTTGYLDARRMSPMGVVSSFLRKTGRTPRTLTIAASVVVLMSDDAGADLDVLFDRAFKRCHMAPPAELRSQPGQLVHAVVPAANWPASRLVNGLLPALEAAAEDLFADRPGARLWIGLHTGDVPLGKEHDNFAVSTAIMAVNTAATSDLLDRVKHGRCVVALSRQVYDTVIRTNRGGSPTPYGKVDPARDDSPYAKVLGSLKYPSETTPGAEQAQRHPGKYTFNGPVDIRHGRIGDDYLGGQPG
jgi:hypothetical protein